MSAHRFFCLSVTTIGLVSFTTSATAQIVVERVGDHNELRLAGGGTFFM